MSIYTHFPTTMTGCQSLYGVLVFGLLCSHLASGRVVAKDVPAVSPVTANESSPWDCEIRAWTRAPDLQPDATIPAEARLALNGSSCNEVIGWQTGLRFKERTIVKLKYAPICLHRPLEY